MRARRGFLTRMAVWLGWLALLTAPVAWYYGLPLGLALLALVLGVGGRIRGDRGVAGLVVPLLALTLGTGVYLVYLYSTEDVSQAGQRLDDSFDDGFDDSFRDLVGDSDGFAEPSAAEDAGAGSDTLDASESAPIERSD